MSVVDLGPKLVARNLHHWKCLACERDFWLNEEDGNEHEHPPVCPWCGEEEE